MSVPASRFRVPATLLALCFAIYAAGIYLTRAFLCQPLGAWVLFGGVAVGGLGWLLLSISTIGRRSLALGLVVAAVALVLAAMFLFIGVLTLPGCSGV